jgi:4-hydroxy-4-methyl-2-oxoglutarate aldolase
MIHVITKIERPSKSTIDNFRNLAVATVYEASGRMGQVNSDIKPIRRGLKLCGPAFTVRCHPKDNLMLHKALEIATPGDVIITTTDGYYQAGYWGDLMTVSAIARKLGGLALDGCIRDSEEIAETGFPVFCRGFSITGTAKDTLGLINHPIIFGGTMVNPGDIILGDDDGMVIVDRTKCDEIYTSANKRVEKEIEKAKLLKSGVTSVELNKLDKVFDAIGMKQD